ncbi:MAG: hypothetical protein HQK76_05025 [Desulfobacterales bacterium]|nr:hypothetical protein [Desulfobacterales bacterium]
MYKMEDTDGEIKRERRRGPDFLVNTIRFLGVLSWLLMFAVMYILQRARPEEVTLMDRFFNLQRNTEWNLALVHRIFYLMIAGLMLSIIGLTFSIKRYRRKSDKYPLSLIFIGLISSAGIIMYILFLAR